MPPDWSLKRLLGKHSSKPANPDIARTLFLAGLIESWGRGIDLIRQACVADAGPAPKFDCDSNGFWVEFRFPARALGNLVGGAGEDEKTSVKTSVKTPEAILRCLTADPTMTLVQVAEEVGKSPRAIELAAAKLVKEGKLKYVGPQKGGRWKVLV